MFLRYALPSLLCLFLFSNSPAQWATDGTKWCYSKKHALSTTTEFTFYEVTGDTTIQGQACKILRRPMDFFCDFRFHEEWMYDSLGKVFFFDVHLNRFELLFDINAQANDSWVTYLSAMDSLTTTVDSVRTELIGNAMLKVLYVSYNVQGPGYFVQHPNSRLIERIGDTHYMFPWRGVACDLVDGGPLRFFEDSLVGSYDTGLADSCTQVITGVTGPASATLAEVYPNPSGGQWNVRMRLPVGETALLEVFDATGKRHHHHQMRVYSKETQHQLTLPQLPSGIYLLRVTAGDQFTQLKLIKY